MSPRAFPFLCFALLAPTLGCAASGIIADDDSGTTPDDSGTKPSDGGKPDVILPTDGGCPQTTKLCGAVCVDVTSDPANCGVCGKACPAPDGGTATCAQSACGGACTNNKTLCGNDGCVDTQTNASHCGGCNMPCGMNEQCLLGVCCAQGQTNCNGKCTDTQSDVSNCGMCGKACDGGGCSAGMCVAQVPTKLGNFTAFAQNSTHSANYLLGSQLTVPKSGKLLQFGVISRSSGPQVILALYTDSGGKPGSLVAYTAATALTNQDQQIAPNVQANLAAGTYWIMGEYNTTASIGYDTSQANAQVDYISHTFNSGLPASFPAPTTYTGQRFNYYVVALQ